MERLVCMSAYSKTPLAKKLTLKDGFRVFWHAMPETVEREIRLTGFDLYIVSSIQSMDAAHIFVFEAAVLKTMLADLRNRIVQNGTIWVSWPKKTSSRL